MLALGGLVSAPDGRAAYRPQHREVGPQRLNVAAERNLCAY